MGRVGKNRVPEYGTWAISKLELFSTETEHDSMSPLTSQVTD